MFTFFYYLLFYLRYQYSFVVTLIKNAVDIGMTLALFWHDIHTIKTLRRD